MPSEGEPLLSVRDLVVEFPRKRSFADVLFASTRRRGARR